MLTTCLHVHLFSCPHLGSWCLLRLIPSCCHLGGQQALLKVGERIKHQTKVPHLQAHRDACGQEMWTLLVGRQQTVPGGSRPCIVDRGSREWDTGIGEHPCADMLCTDGRKLCVCSRLALTVTTLFSPSSYTSRARSNKERRM